MPHIGLFITAKVTGYYDCPILGSMTGEEEAHTTLIGNPLMLMEWSYQISKRGDRNAEATEPTFANYILPYSCQVSMYILSHEYNYRIILSVKISYYHSLKGNQNQKIKQDDDIGGFSSPFPNWMHRMYKYT